MRSSSILFALTACVAVLAGCGGGGSSGSVTPTTSATPTSVATTPAPPPATPTPTLAAYCGNYSLPATGVPLNLTDDSGLGAVLIVYVTNGTDFMDQNGNFTQATAYPIPAACFSNTQPSAASNKPLTIPNGVGGRIYLAYATPNPNPSVVPNPFGSASVSGPNVGYAANPFPWDKVEYNTSAGATIDTTQVDALGLPLELSVSGGALPSGGGSSCTANALPIVGVTSCNYGKIFTALAADPNYGSLVVAQNFNGKLIDMQVVAPKDSVAFTSFQWNLFGLAANLPVPTPSICPASPANGYITCVLSQYQTTPRLFQASNNIGVTGASGDSYCASSDGSANFIFTDVGSATSCTGATPNPNPPAGQVNPFKMPIAEFTYGVPPAADGGGACKQAILFSQPWGNANVGSGHIFATADAFALWKSVTADLNRGTMLSTSATHPVGVTNPSFGIFFQDPMYNTYAQVIHQYFDGNLAYALAYDDLGNFESGVIWNSPDSINVRINAVPTASAATGAPTPVAVPSPCAALPINVGTF